MQCYKSIGKAGETFNHVRYFAFNLVCIQVTNGLVYIVEESVIDPDTRTVEMYTHNFPRNSLYEIVEKTIFTISPLNSKW